MTCVDDQPVAVDDSATVLEDSAPNAIDVLANDTDVDAGPKSVGSVTQPANGTVAITGGGTGLSYQPDANYCNSHAGGHAGHVHVLAQRRLDRDGLRDGDAASRTTRSSPRRRAPRATPRTLAATPIDAAISVTDPDPETIASATVAITGGFQAGADILALSGSHPGITPSLNPAGDTLTLTGLASTAAYQAALRDVTYRNARTRRRRRTGRSRSRSPTTRRGRRRTRRPSRWVPSTIRRSR